MIKYAALHYDNMIRSAHEKKLLVEYLPEGDLLYIRFGDKAPTGTRPVKGFAGINAELDERDRVVGYMVFGFSERPGVLQQLKLPLPKNTPVLSQLLASSAKTRTARHST